MYVSVLKKYTNWDKLSCLSLYIFLSFSGNERRQKPNIPHLKVKSHELNTWKRSCVVLFGKKFEKQKKKSFFWIWRIFLMKSKENNLLDLTFRYLLHFCQKTFPTYHCSFAQINFHKLIIWTNYPLRCAFLQYAGACPKIYFQKGSHAAVTQKDSLRVVRFPIQEFIVGQLFRRLNQISCSLKCAFLKNDFIMNAPLVSWTFPVIKIRWLQ